MPSDLSFEEELVDFLLESSRIQSYVRSRVGPLPLEQGSKVPAITYAEITRTGVQTQQCADPLAAHRWQLDAWAKSYGEMRQLGELIRKRLNGLNGPMGGFSRVVAFLEDKRDTYEDESKLHRGILDFTIWYREEL